MKLLIIAPNEIDGTSWYRVYGVARDLGRFGIEYGQVANSLNWATIQEYDAVLLQRPFHPEHYKMAALVKESMKPLILDYDDDLLNVHPENPVHNVFAKEENYAAIQSICNLADGIIVSNEKLIDVYGQWNCSNFAVVPNAIDDKYWKLRNSHNPDSKNVLYRGSASHIPDVRWLNDVIVKKINESADPWAWHVMGYPISEFYDKLDDKAKENFRYHGWYNLPPYMRVIHSLNPRFAWFPLQNNPFNQRKSNIMWLEATYAGGVLLASQGFDMFDQPGIIQISNETGEWEHAFDDILIRNNIDTQKLWKESCAEIERSFLLSKVNEKRADFISSVTKHTQTLTIEEPNEIASKGVEPYTDKEVFNLQREEHSQENPAYVALYEEFTEAVMKHLKPRSILELGCGTGLLIELFRKKGVDIEGVDMNPHSKAYFDERNPKMKDRFHLADLATYQIPENRCYDLIISIEVFEHMKGVAIHNITKQLKDRGKYFLFSSTPNLSSAVFDKRWGHISVLPTNTWISMFANYDLQFEGSVSDKNGNPTPTEWTCLFSSKRYVKRNPNLSGKYGNR